MQKCRQERRGGKMACVVGHALQGSSKKCSASPLQWLCAENTVMHCNLQIPCKVNATRAATRLTGLSHSSTEIFLLREMLTAPITH